MKTRRPIPKRQQLLGVLLFTLVLGLVSCGGTINISVPHNPTSVAFASTAVTIHVRDNYFAPSVVVAAPERPVTVTFINEGSHVHIVEIFSLTAPTTLQPGDRVSFTITPQKRPYQMDDELYEGTGMVGTFIGGDSATIVVSPTATPIGLLQLGVSAYREYVIQQCESLVQATQVFTNAVIAGDVPKAKSLFASTRQYYERIEPVAESFGTLDPRIDAREGDLPDDQWMGFHRIEQALWVQGTTKGQAQYARQLLSDVKALRSEMDTLALTPTTIIDGSVALLDEASTTKITGEEDRYSHTDLSDLVANVEGSEAAFESFTPYLEVKDPALVSKVRDEFNRFEGTVSPYRVNFFSFVLYSSLSSDQTRAIAQAIDAIGEPLSTVGQLVA